MKESKKEEDGEDKGRPCPSSADDAKEVKKKGGLHRAHTRPRGLGRTLEESEEG